MQVSISIRFTEVTIHIWRAKIKNCFKLWQLEHKRSISLTYNSYIYIYIYEYIYNVTRPIKLKTPPYRRIQKDVAYSIVQLHFIHVVLVLDMIIVDISYGFPEQTLSPSLRSALQSCLA